MGDLFLFQMNNLKNLNIRLKHPCKENLIKIETVFLTHGIRRERRGELIYPNILKEVVNTISSIGLNKIFHSIHAFKDIFRSGIIETPDSLSIESKKYVNYILQNRL